MARAIELNRDHYSVLITTVEAFLKQGREAHTTGFRRHQDTWRRTLLQERSNDALGRSLRWGQTL